MVDRKKLLCLVNLWLAAAAAGLAVLGWLHVLSPYLILMFVFLIGIGFAVNVPAWTSSVSFGGDPRRFAAEYLRNYWSGFRRIAGSVDRT
jgi:hypothetical protein